MANMNQNGGGIGTMMQPKKRINFRSGGSYQGGSGVSGSAESKGMGGAGSSYSGGGGYSSDNNPSGNVNYGSAARDFVQTLNNNNAIRANQNNTRFEPYRGGSRPKGFFAPNGGLSTLTRNFNPMSLLTGLISGNPLGILASLFGKGFKGVKRFNDKIQNSDFGQSKTLVDYFNKKKNKNFTNTGKTTSQLQAEINAGKFDGNSIPKANVTMPGGPGYNLDNFGTGIAPSGPGYELSGFQQPSTITGGMAPNDNEIGNPPPTGIMKAGGYPVNSGSIPFNPGMGSAPIGLQYPGREPNFEQDMMEQDSGMYSGLPNQKAVNAAAMEVMSNAYKDNYPYTQDDFVPGSPFDNPTSIYEAPYGLTNPNVNELTGENYFFNDGNNLANNIINSDIAPQFQDLVSQAGINEAQKSLIDQAANNAKMSGTKIPAGIYDQAKGLDTKAESGFLGFGKQEADPMTQQEYKDYLVSQGYI